MMGAEEATMVANQGLSMFSLFAQASWVVKSIIVLDWVFILELDSHVREIHNVVQTQKKCKSF